MERITYVEAKNKYPGEWITMVNLKYVPTGDNIGNVLYTGNDK